MIAFMFVVWKRGRELHFSEEELFDTVWKVLIVMFIAGRLGYVLLHGDSFGLNVFQWVNVLGKPGFLYYTGLIGAVAAIRWQARENRWDSYAVADVLVTAGALGLGILALGSFFNGSGYGKPTELFVGVNFPGLYDRRHPVQLYEVVLYGLLFLFLWRVEEHYRTFQWYKGNRSEANSGFMAAFFCIIQGFIGLVLYPLRSGLWVGTVRIDGWFHLVLMIVGVMVLGSRSGSKWNEVVAQVSERLQQRNLGRQSSRKMRDQFELGQGIFD
jgi:prolipoprotein diacylglyceryltransferase